MATTTPANGSDFYKRQVATIARVLSSVFSRVFTSYVEPSGFEVILSGMNASDGLASDGGVELGTGTGTFDGFRGYLPDNAGGGGRTHIEYDMTAFSETLALRGQISFECEYELLTINDTVGTVNATGLGSKGNTRGLQEYIMSWGTFQGGAYNLNGEAVKQVGSNAVVINLNDADSAVGFVTHSAGKQKYANVVITWTSPSLGATGTCTTYLDGVKMSVNDYTSPSNPAVANLFNWLYAGGRQDLSVTYNPTENYIRNLAVSSKLASFPIISGTIANTGHSFPAQGIESWAGTSTQTSLLDMTMDNLLQAKIRNKYAKELDLVNHGVGGAFVQRTRGVAYEDSITDILADNPKFVIYMMGANDIIVQTNLAAAVETDMKLDVGDLLAGNVEIVFACTAPTVKTWTTDTTNYDAPAYVANTLQYNNWVEALPAWWDAANPTDSGRVIVIDLFTAFGGENPYANLFRGQVTGSLDDLHPAAWGQQVIANSILDALTPYL